MGAHKRCGSCLAWRLALGLGALWSAMGWIGSAAAQDAPSRVPAVDPVYAAIRRGEGSVVGDGHGWLVIASSSLGRQSTGPAGSRMLLHLPPRTTEGVGEAATAGLEGLVRVAEELPRFSAEHLTTAWWRNVVYLGDTDRAGGSVSVLWAMRSVGSVYDYVPKGRFEALASMPSDVRLVELAATRHGPVALVAEGTGEAPGIRLMRLAGEKWTGIAAPWGMKEPAGAIRILNWREGVAVAVLPQGNGLKGATTDGRMQLWIGQFTSSEPSFISWEARSCELGELAGIESARVTLAFVEGQRPGDDALIAAVFGVPAGCSLFEIHTGAGSGVSSDPMRLASLADVPPTAAVIPMAAPGESFGPPGMIVLGWVDVGGETTRGGAFGGLQLREVSCTTGRVMYAGGARSGGMVNRRAFQSMAVVGLLAGVGAILLMARPKLSTSAPLRMDRAEPLRRLAAAAVDYAPSAMIIALLQGRSALVLLSPWTMLGGGGVSLGELNLAPLGAAIGLTILHAGICEWLWGRSVGKFLMGLRVVSTGAGSAGGVLGARQAVTRNLVRWIMPLLAVFAMLDEYGRHPGDLVAGTMVVPDENDGH